ncbi:MAG TPA: Asp-tRNA(Asn)/Glu-tRNA(Gln) amidotransferase subunit GatB [Deltaproteobacteria bacterium]|nr:Asp-tRNA(Asn)/Glu-tRNA(Gln) amidotransferase subunit GatB [Deltaproteobacteria bacterium]
MRGYDAVIGLEVHAQLLTRSKIFCGCANAFGAEPNACTCPVCLGMPGALPVLNRAVVDAGIRLGLALNCAIETRNVFARKNYFYPDLPKGYQITQYENPLCTGGHLDIRVDETTRRIGIRRVHLEEDAGKNVHDTVRRRSRIDFNRAGVPLLEIVTEPDLRNTVEAVAYLRELRQILMYLGICDGSMEEGSFRCDANVSVRPHGTSGFGVRTELKNMNSFRNVQRALDFEIQRQGTMAASGAQVVQETLMWDAHTGVTRPMRSKEESHDYRYFPDPDLVPVVVDASWIDELRRTMPELPSARRARFTREYGLSDYDAEQLTQTRALADYFEECVRVLNCPKDIANWIMTEVLRVLGEQGCGIDGLRVNPAMLASLISLERDGTVTRLAAKEVFSEMAETGRPAPEIIRERGMEQVSDEAELRHIIRSIMDTFPGQAAQYRAGKTQLLGFFMGEVMKATSGRANPNRAGKLIREMLG